MFKKIEIEGIHGIKGTPQNSGLLAWGTMQWKVCNIASAITPQALNMKALSFPVGENFQVRVNKMAVMVNEHKNDKVGHGFVVPTVT